MTATLSFNVEYPESFKKLLSSTSLLNSQSDSILSFDCFLKNFDFTFFENSQYIMKSFIYCFVPLIISLLFLAVFLVWKCI